MTKARTVAAMALAFALTGACADRTVTTQPSSARDDSPDTTAAADRPASPVASTKPPAAKASLPATTDAQLAEIDLILSQIENEIGTADREATTPERDPTS